MPPKSLTVPPPSTSTTRPGTRSFFNLVQTIAEPSAIRAAARLLQQTNPDIGTIYLVDRLNYGDLVEKIAPPSTPPQSSKISRAMTVPPNPKHPLSPQSSPDRPHKTSRAQTAAPELVFEIDGVLVDPNASDDDDASDEDDSSDDATRDSNAMDISPLSHPPLDTLAAVEISTTPSILSLTEAASVDVKPVMETSVSPMRSNSPTVALLIGESCSPRAYQRVLREQNEMYRVISACQSLGDKMDSLVRELQLSEL